MPAMEVTLQQAVSDAVARLPRWRRRAMERRLRVPLLRDALYDELAEALYNDHEAAKYAHIPVMGEETFRYDSTPIAIGGFSGTPAQQQEAYGSFLAIILTYLPTIISLLRLLFSCLLLAAMLPSPVGAGTTAPLLPPGITVGAVASTAPNGLCPLLFAEACPNGLCPTVQVEIGTCPDGKCPTVRFTKTAKVVETVKPPPPSVTPLRNVRQWNVNGRNAFSVPRSYLISHLKQGVHSGKFTDEELAAASHADLVRWHNEDHEGYPPEKTINKPARATEPKPVTAGSLMNQSGYGCPGGKCPTNTYYTKPKSAGLFNGRLFGRGNRTKR